MIKEEWKIRMNKIKVNYVYSSIYQMLLIILPIITAPYLSRVLGADLLGQYTYTYTIAYYFVMLTMLGISNYGNRCIASAQNDEERRITFTEIHSFQIVWGVLITAIYAFFLVVKNDGIDIWVYILQLGFVVSAIFDVSWYFFGREKFKTSVTRNIFIKGLAAASVFVFVKSKNDLVLYTAIISGYTFLGQFALWLIAVKEENFRFVGANQCKKHVKQICILFMPILAVSIYAYMSKIILGTISSMSELTYYEYAYKIISAPLGLITALGTVMLPRMSNLYANNKAGEANALFEKSFNFSSLIALPMCVGLFIIAPKFSVVFYGADFSKSGIVMAILSLSIPFISWGNVIRTQYLIPLKKDSIFVMSVTFGAVINIVLNFILIPFSGSIGAAIATILTEISVCFFQMFYVRQYLPINSIMKKQNFTIFATLIMLVCIAILDQKVSATPIGVGIIVIVGVVIYAMVSIIINKELRKEVSNIVLKNKGKSTSVVLKKNKSKF